MRAEGADWERAACGAPQWGPPHVDGALALRTSADGTHREGSLPSWEAPHSVASHGKHGWEPSQQERTQGEEPHWEGAHERVGRHPLRSFAVRSTLLGSTAVGTPPRDAKVPNGEHTWRQTESSHPSVGMLPPRWEGSHAWRRGWEPSHRSRVEGSQGRAPLSARACWEDSSLTRCRARAHRVGGVALAPCGGKLPSGKLENEPTQRGTRRGRGQGGTCSHHFASARLQRNARQGPVAQLVARR